MSAMGVSVSARAGAGEDADRKAAAAGAGHFEVVAIVADHGDLRGFQTREIAEGADGVGRRFRIGDGVVSVSGDEHLRDADGEKRLFGTAGGIVGRNAEQEAAGMQRRDGIARAGQRNGFQSALLGREAVEAQGQPLALVG